MVERLSEMIHEILETTKLNGITEQPTTIDLPKLLKEICEPYQLIAAAHKVSFSLDLPEAFTVTLPIRSFSKAVSNVLANAVAYTEAEKTVTVFMDGRSLFIENECALSKAAKFPVCLSLSTALIFPEIVIVAAMGWGFISWTRS